VHHVESGDTLSELAEQYGTSVDALVRLNDIANPDLIIIGDELLISADADVAIDDAPAVEVIDDVANDESDAGDVAPAAIYIIEPGDTLTSLAERFSTTVDVLTALNAIEDPDTIVAGEPIILPFEGEPDHAIGPATDDAETDADADADDSTAVDADGDTETADGGEQNPDEVVAEDSGDGSEAEDVANDDGAPADADTDASDDTADDEDTTETQSAVPSPTPVTVGGASLHLVSAGETLESIAARYGTSADALLDANVHAQSGVYPGMILKIPAVDAAGVQLDGMPVRAEALPLSGEAAAVSVVTAYWGAEIPESDVLAELPRSDDPHAGFRGSPDGEFGGTDDYGVYAEPLAAVLERYGFHAGVFYGEGDASTLLAQLDAGIPVIVWMTWDAASSEPVVASDGAAEFVLVPGKQAAVVYGYDDGGVRIVDVAEGTYRYVSWDDFMRSWGYFNGMALAVAPL
jgi:LysM repeat protein/uncharacterized protein YvpB